MPSTRLLFAACVAVVLATAPPASAQDGRVVRVGLVQFEPLIFQEDGPPRGLFVDILERVALAEGWRLEYVPDSFDGNLSRLEHADIDLLPALAYHADRDRFVDYTREQVMTVWSQVYLRPESEIRNVFDLAGRRVAIVRSDVNGRSFSDYVASFGLQCDFVEVLSLDEVFRRVADGDVEAGVAPNVYGFVHAPSYDLRASAIIFAPNAAYFGVPKGSNADLLAALDDALAAWHANEDPFLEERLNHWYGGREFGKGELPRWLLIAAGSIVALVVLMVVWLRVLNHQVRSRTRDLRRSELRFRNLFETAGDAILILHDGRIVDCNARALEIFRRGRESLLGREPHELAPRRQPDGRDSETAARTRLESAANGDAGHFEWLCLRGDEEFSAEVTLTRFSVDHRSYVQAIVRDVTERRRLESDLRQAQKMEAIGNLAGGIAHDFNNILSSMMGFAELALMESAEDAPLRGHLDQVLQGGERARDLVRQILAFGRRTIEDRTHLRIDVLVDETLRLLRSSLPATIAITTDIRSHGPVRADATGIHQILMNLCTNAGQAMSRDGGELRVSLYERPGAEGPVVVLEVRDSGPGMDRVEQQQIFEPYFTTKKAEGGTGLGLAVVHGIVSEHDGRIEVESAPGKGTLFRVTLPRSEEAAPPPEPAERRVVPTEAARVLLVDDELDIVTVGVKGLERLGMKVTGCLRPEGALAIFADGPDAFDVLVTDMTMPGLTGAELCARLREIRPGLPVVLCTGYTDAVTAEAARELGVSAFLVKPVSVERLAATIDEVLSGVAV